MAGTGPSGRVPPDRARLPRRSDLGQRGKRGLQPVIGKIAITLGRRYPHDSYPKGRCSQVAEGVEVRALSSPATGMRKVDGLLCRPVGISPLVPAADQPAVLRDVEEDVVLGRVVGERVEAVASEVLNLVDLDGEPTLCDE